MKSDKRIVRVGLMLLSLVIATTYALGDDNKHQSNWDKLKQLSASEEIQVVETDAKSNRGTFRSVTDEAIVMSTATGEKTIGRQSVARVSSKGKPHRMRNALIGTGIGAGAGLGIGAAMDSSSNNNTPGAFGPFFPNLGKEVGTPVGAIIGAIIGAVLPTGGWHEVYRAR